MSQRLIKQLGSLALLLPPALIFLYRHRAVIAFVLEIIPDILRYAADPPPDDTERDVTPKPSKRLRRKRTQ